MTTINYNNKKMKLPFEIKTHERVGEDSFDSDGKKNEPAER
jgi:hypothetical protein